MKRRREGEGGAERRRQKADRIKRARGGKGNDDASARTPREFPPNHGNSRVTAPRSDEPTSKHLRELLRIGANDIDAISF